MSTANDSVASLTDRPLPSYTEDTGPWWTALRAGRLTLQECLACNYRQHPPEPICMRCQSFEVVWRETVGTGTIVSHVTYHEPRIPGFTYPYSVVLVGLDEGVRMVGLYEASESHPKPSIDLPVKANITVDGYHASLTFGHVTI